MKYSVIKYNEVCSHNELRMEAEYYSPEYVELNKKLKKINSKNLGDFVDEIRCGPFGSTILCDTYDQNGVIVARPFNIKDCSIEDNNLAYVSEKDCTEKCLKIYKQGDVFFSRVGDIRCGIVPAFKNKITISPNIIAVRTNSRKLSPYYIAIFFNTKYGYLQLLRNLKVVAQPTIPTEIIKNLKIVAPSNDFQNKIDNLFKLSFLKTEEVPILYQGSKNILFKELNLLNWQPEHKLYSIKKYSDVEKVNRIDAEYFQPKYDEIIKKIKSYSNGWDKMSNIVQAPKKGLEVGSKEYCEQGTPFVRVSNLSKLEINDNNMQYISEKYYNSIANVYQPKKGEILLSKDGTPGIAYYLSETPQKMIPSGGILRLIVNNKEYLPEYLTLVLNSVIVQMQVERVSSGALIKHWLVDEIQNTLIPKLEMSKQIEIVEQLKEATKLRRHAKQLLEIAKRGVEIAIEENEDIATEWINKQLEKLK